MSDNDQALPKFKPERPIYLHEDNTGFKTKVEVLLAIQKLRDLHWLCAYNEKIRPLHMSFNDEKEFQQFKKDCDTLQIALKAPIMHADDIEAIIEEESKNIVAPEENHETVEDSKGRTKVIRK